MRFGIYKSLIFPIFTVFLFTVLFVECQVKDSHQNEKDRIIGVKIYEIDGDVKMLFEEWEELGINTVFASPSVMNDEFRALAKKHNIETFIILPIFYNPDTLKVRPDLYAITNRGEKAVEGWVEFVCPSRDNYRKEKIEYIKILMHDFNPDGLSLDFIRHFVFWERVYPDREPNSIPNTCFDSHCMEKFQTDKNILIPDNLKNAPEIAEWIKNEHLDEWTEWKCELIISMVRDIVQEAKQINPKIKINVHAVPWRQQDFGNGIKVIAGQDFSKISPFVDIISPMTYAPMVKREPEWISSVVQDIAAQSDCGIIPSIQVSSPSESGSVEDSSVKKFEQSLIEALKPPSTGVVFWSWERFEKNPIEKEILKSYLDE